MMIDDTKTQSQEIIARQEKLVRLLEKIFTNLNIKKDSAEENTLLYVFNEVFTAVYDDTLEVTNLPGLIDYLHTCKEAIQEIENKLQSSSGNQDSRYNQTLAIYNTVFTKGIDDIIAKYEAMAKTPLCTREESKLNFGIDASLMRAFQISEQKFGVFKVHDDNRYCFSLEKDIVVTEGTNFLICQFDSRSKVNSRSCKGLREDEAVILGRDTLQSTFTYDDSVSRKHVKVELVNETPEITDLNSTNGTIELAKEQILVPHTTVAEIIGEDNIASLSESMQTYVSKFGSEIAASSDKGINYKDRNEDRVVVDADSEFFAVIDGMGGYSGGETAAQIIAEELSQNSDNIEEAIEQASNRISMAIDQKIINNESAAAAFVAAKIIRLKEKITVEYTYSGDCALVIIDKNGIIKHVGLKNSLADKLVAEKVLTPDQALYFGNRHIALGGISKDSVEFHTKTLNVSQGDRIILMSDGIDDNLTPEEIASIIKNKSAKEALLALDIVTSARMKNADQIIDDTPNRAKSGTYQDGYKSEPKPDNRGLVIFDIK